MTYIEIKFDNLQEDLIDILIASLNELPFSGFEEKNNSLYAYIMEEDFNENLLTILIDKYDIKYTKSVIYNKNWNEIWESSFEPISVFSKDNNELFCYVRANFHKVNNAALFDLIITPKMSFGTGHHATTFQMMEEMSKIDFKNKNVIDFGTGTGLLSILAEKMGAKHVLALDNDDWSIENTRENLLANECKNIEVKKTDSCIHVEKADIILANINLNVILKNIENIKQSANSNSLILFSGLLTDDETTITTALNQHGFSIKYISSKNHWLVINTSL